MSDSASQANGGLIGPLNVNDLSPDFRKMHRADEARRHDPGHSHAARLPDSEARIRDADEDRCRSTRRASKSAIACSRTSARQSSRSTWSSCAPQAIIEWKNADMKKAYDEGLAAAGEGRGGATASVTDRRDRRSGSRSGPARVTSRSSASSWSGSSIEAFLPTITRWSRWKDRKKKIDWPLFPGYCFARFDPEDALPILKCTGVVNIVSFEGKPAPIPEYELDSIRVLIGSELQYDPCPLIHEGMMVEVVHGPLQGRRRAADAKDAPQARLVLSVDLIGQAVSVEVDAADVKPY